MIGLRGLTWEHPRGHAGLVAASQVIEQEMGTVRVAWDTHSLAAFSASPIAEVVGDHDLVIFDHPFVGDVSKDKVLLDLSRFLDADFVANLEKDVVDHGIDIYRYDGGLWALPIDAACQVSALRSDLCARAGLNTEALREMTLTDIIARLSAKNLKAGDIFQWRRQSDDLFHYLLQARLTALCRRPHGSCRGWPRSHRHDEDDTGRGARRRARLGFHRMS